MRGRFGRIGRVVGLGSFGGLIAGLGSFGPSLARADDPPKAEQPRPAVALDRKSDVIYGRKAGLALTMDVFTPKTGANGAGVILIVSSGFVSSHAAISPMLGRPLLDRGYTVFAVVHGSQPQFTIPEAVADVNRAIRFVRHHAADYAIDPGRIGVTGASAGGHLSLMLGAAPEAPKPDAADPVDRQSGRADAVACFFPPTDFLNWGEPGHEQVRIQDFLPPFRPAFEFREIDKAINLWRTIDDDERRRAITRAISPAQHASADDAPTLIIHGEADSLVPVQQSELMVAKLREAGVDAQLVVKPKAGHGWMTMGRDQEAFADWFDAHLPRKAQ